MVCGKSQCKQCKEGARQQVRARKQPAQIWFQPGEQPVGIENWKANRQPIEPRLQTLAPLLPLAISEQDTALVGSLGNDQPVLIEIGEKLLQVSGCYPLRWKCGGELAADVLKAVFAV